MAEADKTGIRRAVSVPPSPAVAFVAAVLVHGAFVVLMGVRHAPDTTFYTDGADALIASGFDYVQVVAGTETTYPPLLYVGFLTVVAVLKLLFGPEWDTALVALNLVSQGAVGLLLVRLVGQLTKSIAAAWTALLLFLITFDLFHWAPYAISDPTFLLLSFAVYALVAERLLKGGRGWGWAWVFLLALLAAFYRPTGIVLLPATAWAYFLACTRPGKLRKTATALVAVGAAGGTLLFAWIMQDPSRWPFELVSHTVRETAEFYATGEVVSARPHTFHSQPASVLDFAAISLDRLVHFFAIGTRQFSIAHNLVNAGFYVPLYGLILVFAAALLSAKDRFSDEQKTVFLAAIGFISVTAVFHGLLQVDFDWRYRVPVLPHMILLAAGGAAILMRQRTQR